MKVLGIKYRWRIKLPMLIIIQLDGVYREIKTDGANITPLTRKKEIPCKNGNAPRLRELDGLSYQIIE